MHFKFSRHCLSFFTLMFLFKKVSCEKPWIVVDDGNFFEDDHCVLKTGGEGICTRISKCTIYLEALISETMNYSDIGQCSFADDFEQVICCPYQAATKAPIVKRMRASKVACQRYRAINLGNLVPHILNGTKARIENYPHIAAIVYDTVNGPEIKCGGSLISERFVLTAAHCLVTRDTYKVRLGATSLSSTEGAIDIEVEEKFIHKKYKSSRKYHDIALLKLKEDVTFTYRIKPACLYTNRQDVDSSKNLTVIGWGITDVLLGKKSKDLLEVTVTTMPLEQCNKMYAPNEDRSDRALRRGLNRGQYCAHDENFNGDSCSGDSGGPLQLSDGRNSKIVGIVSFGWSCGSAIPSVYTRVAYYLGWIERIVWRYTQTANDEYI